MSTWPAQVNPLSKQTEQVAPSTAKIWCGMCAEKKQTHMQNLSLKWRSIVSVKVLPLNKYENASLYQLSMFSYRHFKQASNRFIPIKLRLSRSSSNGEGLEWQATQKENRKLFEKELVLAGPYRAATTLELYQRPRSQNSPRQRTLRR